MSALYDAMIFSWLRVEKKLAQKLNERKCEKQAKQSYLAVKFAQRLLIGCSSIKHDEMLRMQTLKLRAPSMCYQDTKLSRVMPRVLLLLLFKLSLENLFLVYITVVGIGLFFQLFCLFEASTLGAHQIVTLWFL